MITRQDYTGPADLRRMQELVQRTWTPRSEWHIGDVAWNLNLHAGPTPEWPTALWTADGVVRAWAWATPPAELSLSVDPGFPELIAPVIAWFEAVVAPDAPREVVVIETAAAVIDGLRAAGYQARPELPHFLINHRDLTDLPAITLPAGFSLRPVAPGEAAPRVAVHQAAFAPSKRTAESYAQVMDTWPYRHDLDWVAVAPDGTFAASCLIWFDPVNLVGELEPVGTHPDYRRQGLARAACLGALHALRAAGANRAVVLCRGDADNPGPRLLYHGLGFHPVDRTVTFTRDAPGATADN